MIGFPYYSNLVRAFVEVFRDTGLGFRELGWGFRLEFMASGAELRVACPKPPRAMAQITLCWVLPPYSDSP